MTRAKVLGAALRDARTKAGLSQAAFGAAAGYERSSIAHIERGDQRPPAEFWTLADELCGATGTLLATYRRYYDNPDSTKWTVRSEPIGDDWVETLHRRILNFVELDNTTGGDHTVPLAIQAFTVAQKQAAVRPCRPGREADVHAALGELAEVAGWLAYDASLHDQARWLNLEARHHLSLAGHTSLDLLVCQNMAMHATHLRNAAEALSLTRSVLTGRRLTPRLRCLYRLREARALAVAGDSAEAQRVWRHACALYQDGTVDTDPAWAWWISDRELLGQHGMLAADCGDLDTAIAVTSRSLEITPKTERSRRYNHLAHLFRMQVRATAWNDAETTLQRIWPYVDEVGSTRSRTTVRRALDEAGRSTHPAARRLAVTEV